MAELTGGPAPSKPAPARPPAARTSTPPPQPQGQRQKARADLPADLDIDIGGPPAAPAARPRTIPPPPPPAALASSPLTIGRLGKSRVFPDESQAPSTTSTNGASSQPPPPPLWDDEEPSADEPPPVKNGAAAAEALARNSASVDPSAEGRSGLNDPFAGMELDAVGGPHSPLHASDPSLLRLSAPPAAPDSDEAEEAPPAEGRAPAPGLDAPPAPPRSPRRQIVSSALTGLVGAALALLLAVGPTAFFEGRFGDLVGAGDMVAVQEASGLYDTVSGRPVFFVRGHVENRSRRMSGSVRIVATLIGDSGPSARAESVAGVQLSPEEVYSVRSPADADKLVKSLAQKAGGDRRVPPGGSLPFLALFADPPMNLSKHKIQLRLESAETATSR